MPRPFHDFVGLTRAAFEAAFLRPCAFDVACWHLETCRPALAMSVVDRKWPTDRQNDAIDPER